jgi:hypothetical protein
MYAHTHTYTHSSHVVMHVDDVLYLFLQKQKLAQRYKHFLRISIWR